MSFLSPSQPRCRRSGRVLIEALLALTLAAASLLAMRRIAEAALAMGDAALQYDLAAQSSAQATSEALRAPCSLAGARWQAAWSVRHESERVSAPGVVSTVRVDERWRTVGAGRHDSVAAVSRIGVRCD